MGLLLCHPAAALVRAGFIISSCRCLHFPRVHSAASLEISPLTKRQITSSLSVAADSAMQFSIRQCQVSLLSAIKASSWSSSGFFLFFMQPCFHQTLVHTFIKLFENLRIQVRKKNKKCKLGCSRLSREYPPKAIS